MPPFFFRDLSYFGRGGGGGEGERERDSGEDAALSKEPDGGRSLMTLRSSPEPKPRVGATVPTFLSEELVFPESTSWWLEYVSEEGRMVYGFPRGCEQ